MRYPDLEIELLRAFVAVAESGGFTAASGVVGRSQSAVSQKVSRLEELVGCKLFDRTSRSLSLTRDGERLLVTARQMLELNDLTVRSMREPATVGTLRLGISEDFIPRQLPGLLTRFRRLYPEVHLELMTGLSCDLLDVYEAGGLDVAIAKKDGMAQRGRVIWREPLVWLASAGYQPDFSKPVELVLLKPPCTYRELMMRTLDSVRQPWIASCTARSLMGVQAAAAGGLGMTILGRSFVRDGLQVVATPDSWPTLPMTEIVLLGEETAEADLVRPLVSFLTETLAGTGTLTLVA
ncbi:LysR substrate-binding domain-containing protein [Bradyrhizobium neotropicale]|uniref:LysR substrate-binding domain-containing protein n=1 Tax=Bradyrhizobium neotropicale TaxID=1497615 RepID=UPI001AD6B810|nr:LysR substrate-binding domain-containing protein [Bradyrhizobium neotropicale]MBO4223857.1 LysR family transcriptional regulator [Bradyrhizobium neotropicale]